MKYLASLLLAIGLLGSSQALLAAEAHQGAETRMQPVSFASWEAAQNSYQGKILVVDLWASWCSPCIERFPHMVEMFHRFNERGVQFISLNFDEQGDTESLDWANDFLARVGAVFPNYHMDENMTAAFDRLKLLGLPVVQIFDPAGNEAYRLTGDNPNRQFNAQDVEKAVLALLAAGSDW